MLGPFNFPLHLVHGLVVPALAMGNTVLVKFSEHCPALAERYAAAIEVAGLQQVVGIVQGGVTTANHALLHPAIRTVAAVGGIAMGRSLQQALQARPEVVLALEMGGVNPALVCADAVQEKVVPLLAEGAWKQSGQRCTATRIVHRLCRRPDRRPGPVAARCHRPLDSRTGQASFYGHHACSSEGFSLACRPAGRPAPRSHG